MNSFTSSSLATSSLAAAPPTSALAAASDSACVSDPPVSTNGEELNELVHWHSLIGVRRTAGRGAEGEERVGGAPQVGVGEPVLDGGRRAHYYQLVIEFPFAS